MALLVFQLKAPLASFGTLAGERRPTELNPRRSTVTGLLAAAIGITRGQDDAFRALSGSFRMACAVLAAPSVLTDYHTVEAPGKRIGYTRRQQLQFSADQGKSSNTMPTRRDYVQDGHWLIALYGDSEVLQRLRDALEQPAFTLYLGRKSCVLSSFTAPVISQEETVEAAMSKWLSCEGLHLGIPDASPVTLLWEQGAPCKTLPLLRRRRMDVRTALSVNTFSGRIEHEATVQLK